MIHLVYATITLVVFGAALAGVIFLFKRGFERAERKRREPPQPELFEDKGGGYYTPSTEFWGRLRADNPGLPETPPTVKYEFRLAWKRSVVIGFGFLGAGFAKMGFWPEEGGPDWRIGAAGVAVSCICLAIAVDYILRAIRDR
jgi:hypothetical protein